MQGIPWQGLAPRKILGIPDQSPGPYLNLHLDPQVLEGSRQHQNLILIDLPRAGFTMEIIADATATATLPCLLKLGQILIRSVTLSVWGALVHHRKRFNRSVL